MRIVKNPYSIFKRWKSNNFKRITSENKYFYNTWMKLKRKAFYLFVTHLSSASRCDVAKGNKCQSHNGDQNVIYLINLIITDRGLLLPDFTVKSLKTHYGQILTSYTIHVATFAS